MSIETIRTKSKNTNFYNPDEVSDLEVELWNTINKDTKYSLLWLSGLFTLLCIVFCLYIVF